METVKIIECPRDAWQGLPQQIPTEVKAAHLKTNGVLNVYRVEGFSCPDINKGR